MFIKKLMISNQKGIIRDIEFHRGLNLIVDETIHIVDIEKKNTPNIDRETGNSVGKTTVLKLIDFCLGAEPKIIYTDKENNKEIALVKDFLVNTKVLISLVLKEDLDDADSKEILIERNFLNRKLKVMRINGENYVKNKGKDFDDALDTLIIGDREHKKPSLRQIIAHSIRYTDERINNTLKVLTLYTSLAEYELLFLFLFGITITDRSKILKSIKAEKEFKKRIEKKQSKNELELSNEIINDKLLELEMRKKTLNLNFNYDRDLNEINTIKYEIGSVSSRITELSLRKKIILEAEAELRTTKSDIDLQQLRRIYSQASEYIANLQKTFEDLVAYHNNMVIEKIRFLTQDIPEIDQQILALSEELRRLLAREEQLAIKIANSDTFSDLEVIIAELNESYHRKGEIENSLKQIDEVNQKINSLEADLVNIDVDVFSNEFQEKIKSQLKKFNKFFSEVSTELYGESYGVTFGVKEEQKTGKNIYTFDSFNANSSSGKKQGEILCFDLAYILFADEENIPVLHFILNDKKELMHSNQLIKVAGFAKNKNIQLIFSILEDKLPLELNNMEYIVLRLSQSDKLFRIETTN